MRFSLQNVEADWDEDEEEESYKLGSVARVATLYRCDVPDVHNAPNDASRGDPVPPKFGWDTLDDPGVCMMERTLGDAMQAADDTLRKLGWVL